MAQKPSNTVTEGIQVTRYTYHGKISELVHYSVISSDNKIKRVFGNLFA